MNLILKNIIFFLFLTTLFSCEQSEKVPVIPVNDFFKSQDKAYYRLSPDGKYISYLKLQNKKQNLFVEEIATGKLTQLTRLIEKNITFYCWVSNQELIYYKEKSGAIDQADLYIATKDGQREKKLNANEKIRLRILDDQLIDKKYLLVLSSQRDSTYADVYKLNVRDGSLKMVLKNPGTYTGLVTDGKGRLRLAISSDGVNEAFWYREDEAKPFKKIIVNNFKTSIYPIAFAENKPNILYAISDVNRDKCALVEIDCNTGMEKRVIFYNDTLNVVEAQYSKKQAKLEYVVYETWKKEKVYLDSAFKTMYQQVDKLFPKTETRIIDQDKDENIFIIRTFTDRNPGSYYLFNANTKALKKLTDINASIDPSVMCEMRPISFTARDGLKINGYLTLPKGKKTKNLPTIVYPHGGPGQRNGWGFNSDVQFLANRGYAVLQINYRGSTGYGKNFYTMGFKQWGGKIQDDVDDGVKWLINRKIANPDKVAIYGYGFGGYIALTSAASNTKLYKCAASNMGTLNLFSYLKAIPPYYKAYLEMYYEIVGNPDIDAEYMRQASPVFHANKVKIPVFITQSTKDQWINANDAIQYVKELKKLNAPVVYLEQENGNTTVIRDENRQKMYSSLEQFFQNNLNKK
jgi:dipeptidyl aminopeptidase/acylaminoacyl peptidase